MVTENDKQIFSYVHSLSPFKGQARKFKHVPWLYVLFHAYVIHSVLLKRLTLQSFTVQQTPVSNSIRQKSTSNLYDFYFVNVQSTVSKYYVVCDLWSVIVCNSTATIQRKDRPRNRERWPSVFTLWISSWINGN